jgi:hypothetical protein
MLAAGNIACAVYGAAGRAALQKEDRPEPLHPFIWRHPGVLATKVG